MNDAFPTVDQLARLLEAEKPYIEDESVDEPGEEPGIEVRLQVVDGSWDLLTGDPCYDQDHRGWWGCGCLTRNTDTRELAEELIAEAQADRAQSED